MNPKTLKALQGSIKKWEGIIVDTAIDKGAINCPLCELFLGGRCKECPVAKAVNSIYCEDTPYIEYHRHNINVIFYGEEEIDQRKKAAQRELDFLRSLLPLVGENIDAP